jgi:uncharacterized protein YqgC (DUF456 family)
MVELVTVAALALVVLGVVGSVAPLLPGALLSLAGVYLYWWGTGFAEPSAVVLAAFTVVAVAAAAADYFGGALAAGAGGASTRTMLAAGVVGAALFFVTGPVGVLVGVAGTVFAVEFHRNRDARQGARAAAYATLGMLGSVVVQLLVTLSMLAAFLVVAFL